MGVGGRPQRGEAAQRQLLWEEVGVVVAVVWRRPAHGGLRAARGDELQRERVEKRRQGGEEARVEGLQPQQLAAEPHVVAQHPERGEQRGVRARRSSTIRTTTLISAAALDGEEGEVEGCARDDGGGGGEQGGCAGEGGRERGAMAGGDVDEHDVQDGGHLQWRGGRSRR